MCLFDDEKPAPDRHALAKPALIGSGPDGETCKSCANKTQVWGRYYKCILMMQYWTRGTATDLRLKDPACKYWKGND